jgi:hypothetical protein
VKNNQSTSCTDLPSRFLALEPGSEEAPAFALMIRHFQLARENMENLTLAAMDAGPPA